MKITPLALSALVGFLPIVTAHSWIEQLMVIAPNGTLVGQPGFPRGNLLRGTPQFNDPGMVNLIPPDGRPVNQIFPTDLMCRSTQTSQTQTDGSPRLQAAPGSAIALRFQENGHVTLPDNIPGKPANRGTVYVYGTTQPSPDDSFLAIHRVWNAEGTGGDGRGVLLSTRNFDDGQCYQINGGAISASRQQQFFHPFNMVMGSDLWCQQDIVLPANAPTGQPYTLYWVWDWPTLPGTPGLQEGKQEIYTTCMDIDVIPGGGVEQVSAFQGNGYLQGQDLAFAAVQNQFSDMTNPTAVTGQNIPFGFTLTFISANSSILKTSNVTSSADHFPSTRFPEYPLTKSIGQVIPFGASATGPAAGAASQASATAAATDANPDFLSVHTKSTAGAGVETQSFSVIPIGVTEVPVPTQAPGNGDSEGQNGGGGDRGNGRGGEANGDDSPQVTPAGLVGNANVATFTKWEAVTETVFQTVYNTRFTKRDELPSPTAAPANADVSLAIRAPEATSIAHGVYKLRARNPFVMLGWMKDKAEPTPTSS